MNGRSLSSIYYSLTARELMMMGLDVIEVRSIIHSSQNLHNIYVLTYIMKTSSSDQLDSNTSAVLSNWGDSWSD